MAGLKFALTKKFSISSSQCDDDIIYIFYRHYLNHNDLVEKVLNNYIISLNWISISIVKKSK
ncbi:hypothetical protein BpHYR1_007151 [Brachionus plicatilis]|uniref:Uncharacterized protein n=1 Tax=Brachionus plicatilis TaxID=10195 RepID=A0A3M7QBG1_BRAPC|nr:hypothetical protein BpHYR1_007151 [Brachionus plicatilis]